MAHSIRSLHSAGRAASHRHGSGAVLPGTTSRSWPRRTSTIWVDHDNVRNRPRRANNVSSRPSAVTSPIRSGWSTSCSPITTTASITVCQPQPSSRATSDTARPLRPTCNVDQRAARVVSAQRAVAISGSSSHQQRPQAVQRQRCLRHTSRVGLPNTGKSTNSTSRIPCRCTRPPHEQPGRSAGNSTTTRSQFGQSPTPIKFTSGKPTSSAHIRVTSVSKQGLLATQRLRHR